MCFVQSSRPPAAAVKSNLKAALASAEGTVLNYFQNTLRLDRPSAHLLLVTVAPRLSDSTLPVCVVHFDKSCLTQSDESEGVLLSTFSQETAQTNQTAAAQMSDLMNLSLTSRPAHRAKFI